jgi:predicted nucleic acid-binding protein
VATVRILVDTDVFIDYFNIGRYTEILDDGRLTIYYSVVTRKELLSKPGLKDSERRAIVAELRRFRLVPLTPGIARRYAAVRRSTSGLEREDALIAATALEKRLPLLTGNWRHFVSSPGSGVTLDATGRTTYRGACTSRGSRPVSRVNER